MSTIKQTDGTMLIQIKSWSPTSNVVSQLTRTHCPHSAAVTGNLGSPTLIRCLSSNETMVCQKYSKFLLVPKKCCCMVGIWVVLTKLSCLYHELNIKPSSVVYLRPGILSFRPELQAYPWFRWNRGSIRAFCLYMLMKIVYWNHFGQVCDTSMSLIVNRWPNNLV